MKKPTSQNIKSFLNTFLAVVIPMALGFGMGAYYINDRKEQPIVVNKVEQTEASVSATAVKPTIDYVNALRAERGLPALKDDERLDTSALKKANDMIIRGYYDHSDPNGLPFQRFIFAQVPSFDQVGENIGKCYHSQEDVYAAYKASPSHYANIISTKYTLYGSAMVWNEAQHCMYWVDHFGGF